MSRDIVLGNIPRKALFSLLLLTCQEAVACRCLAELRSCQEASGHSLWLRSGLPCAKSQPWQLHPWVLMSSTCLPRLQTPAPTRCFTLMQVTPWPEGPPSEPWFLLWQSPGLFESLSLRKVLGPQNKRSFIYKRRLMILPKVLFFTWRNSGGEGRETLESIFRSRGSQSPGGTLKNEILGRPWWHSG